MNVVFISSASWYGIIHGRNHHIADLLSRAGCRVLVIEPAFVKPNAFINPNLEAWYPDSGKRVRRSTRLDPEYVRKFEEYAKAEHKVVILQMPAFAEYLPLFKRLGYKVVFDLCDEPEVFKYASRYDRGSTEYLLRNSDLVITTAKSLYEKVKPFNKSTFLIQNGAEFEHFVLSRKKSGKRPADMPKGKPVVGYFGSIWTWTDVDLILHLARKRPNYDIVLIGVVLPSLESKIKGVKNIHPLGAKDYLVLPDYLRHFDACILPFKVQEITRSTDPVKAYEYLAGGKPMVSVDLPEMRRFPEAILASTPDSFVAGVDNALSKKPDLRKIDEFLRDNTWESRVAEIIARINSLWRKPALPFRGFRERTGFYYESPAKVLSSKEFLVAAARKEDLSRNQLAQLIAKLNRLTEMYGEQETRHAAEIRKMAHTEEFELRIARLPRRAYHKVIRTAKGIIMKDKKGEPDG